MFTTKDRQIYFYYARQRAFFYQARSPIAAVRLGKMMIYPQEPPVYCLVVVSQSQYVTIFYNITLYEYRKHTALKEGLERCLRARCAKVLEGVPVGQAATNLIANFLHS